MIGCKKSVIQVWRFCIATYKITFFCTLVSISALWLSSCSLAPKYKQPPLPVASAYPLATKTLTNKITNNRIAVDVAWRDYFADPYLQTLITTALDNNRDLRIAALRVKEAQATYRIERSKQFPTINADVDVSQTRLPGDISTTGTARVFNQYQIDLGLASWELDLWGRILNLKKAALENFLATDAARRAATVSLISQVAENYLILREFDERIMIAEQTVQSHQKSFRIFSERFKIGAISQLDLSQVETLLTQAQALGTQLEQSRAAAINTLTLLVGTPIASPPKNVRFDDNIVLHELRVGLPSELLTVRPDVIAAEHQLKAAGANIGAARAAFFPQITLTGWLGTTSNELGGLFKNGSGTWNYAPSLTLPIFNAGRNRAALNLAEIRSNIMVANYEKTIQTAFREVADALSARHWLSQQVRVHQRMLAAENKRAYLAEMRYDNGAAPYLEVLDAQRDLLAAEQQLVQTRRALLSSRVRLYAALGGGSQYFITEPPKANTNYLPANRVNKK